MTWLDTLSCCVGSLFSAACPDRNRGRLQCGSVRGGWFQVEYRLCSVLGFFLVVKFLQGFFIQDDSSSWNLQRHKMKFGEVASYSACCFSDRPRLLFRSQFAMQPLWRIIFFSRKSWGFAKNMSQNYTDNSTVSPSYFCTRDGFRPLRPLSVCF